MKVGDFYIKTVNNDAEDGIRAVSFSKSSLDGFIFLSIGEEDVPTSSKLYFQRLIKALSDAGFKATVEEHRTVETVEVSEYKIEFF